MLHLTPFAPFFLVLLLIACCGIRGWMFATGASAFIQSAAPLMIAAGGRDSGLIPGYGLMFIGLAHVVLLQLQPRRSGPIARDASSAPVFWLILFTLVGVVGAVLLPRVFEGSARVVPPAYGLDRVFIERVHPSGRNLVQSTYLLCNLSLFLICRWVIRSGAVTMQFALRALAVGACIAAFVGLYQVAAFQLGWPWPSEVVNSNTGVGQEYKQTVFGLQRMSATFLEPSLLGFHFVSAFALFGIGLRDRTMGALLLLCLLISTSSSAYAGLLLLFPIAVLVYARQSDGRAALVLAVFAVVVGSAYLVDLVWMHGAISSTFLTNKLSSNSGIDRTRTAWFAIDTVRDSWGLGVGVGSTRVSGLPLTLAATVGIPGLICLAGFLTRLLAACLARRDQMGNAFGLAIAALVIVWALSIPDLAIPYAWVLCGLGCGLLSLPVPSSAPAQAGSPAPMPLTPINHELLA